MKLEIKDLKGSPQEIEWVKNIYPMYLHDLSEFGEELYKLNQHGQWEPDYLPSWLSDPNAHPLILRWKGQPVGFAFVAQAPFGSISSNIDYRMSEFFILRRYRRKYIGKQAAFAIFDRFPGRWEVTELPGNSPALFFWRDVISEYTGGQFDQTTMNGGPRQSFIAQVKIDGHPGQVEVLK